MKNHFLLSLVLCGFFVTSAGQIKQFRNNLFIISPQGEAVLMDGTLSLYHDDYNNEVDHQDARKMFNPGENFGILRDGKTLIIERRQDIKGPDTTFLKIWNTRVITYRLQLISKNFEGSPLRGVLYDHYLNRQIEIDFANGTYYDFSVTTDPESKRTDRFMVVFNTTVSEALLPLDFVEALATVSNQKVTLSWTTENEQNIKNYTIERSPDGRNFSSTDIVVQPANKPLNKYTASDNLPLTGVSYYRIKATDIDGRITFSKVLKAAVADASVSASLYPNPATNSHIKLHMHGHEEGTYRVSIINNFGKILHTQTEVLTSGPVQINITPTHNLTKGIYRVEVTGPSGYRSVHNLLLSQ